MTITQPAAKANYPLVRGGGSRAQRTAAISGVGVGIGLSLLYLHYLHTDDVAPDSLYGLAFAIVGTSLLLLVGLGFVLRKRIRRPWVGRLHTVLAWHMVGGVLGLALIFMHAAGNFNPRSGTYALYGLLAVVVSGLIGRVLDRVCPRLAAETALATLSVEGEERITVLERRLSAPPIPSLPSHPAPAPPPRPAANSSAPWDLAYHELDPATRAVPVLLGRHTTKSRAGGETRGKVERRPSPRTLRRRVREEAGELRVALGNEQFFIQLVRVWRRIHVALCVAALALLAWHIEYAVTLLMNTWHS